LGAKQVKIYKLYSTIFKRLS